MVKQLITAGTIALLLTGSPLFAQRGRVQRSGSGDSTIKNTTLDVYQVYKPELKPYVRPELQPSLPPPPAQEAEPTYNVPQQTLYYSYRSLPLRPLALGKDTTPPPTQNYIKLGGGNLSTFLGEAGIGSVHGQHWQASALGHFLTQEGDIQGQRYLHAGVIADGSYKTAQHIISAGVEGDYRRYSLYGYNHDAYHYTNSDLARPFTFLSVSAGIRNTEPGPYGIDYAPQIRLSDLFAKPISGERTIAIDLPVSKKIDTSLTAGIGLSGVFTHLDPGYDYPSNNIVQIKPAFDINRNGLIACIGLYPTFGNNGTTYLLPELTGRYKLRNAPFAVSAGWQAMLIQNTYRQLSLKNPYLLNPTLATQTRQDEVYIGLDGGVGSHFSFSGRASWWQWHGLPLFTNAWWTGDGKEFGLVYDPKVTALSLQATARYQFAESFLLSVSGTWYAYTQKTLEHVWGEPSVRMRADLQWRVIHDLQLNGYATILDGIYAQDATGASVKLKGTLDIGGSAEYNLIKKLALFANVSNLLNNRNERWLGYQSFGINVVGGLRFRF